MRVPVIEHVLSWHAVTEVPVDEIRLIHGGVNNADFLGAPAETLLFDSATIDTEFVLPLRFDDPRQTFRVDYIFREMQILNAAGGREATWGWVFRSSPPDRIGWAEVNLADGSRLFQLRDFRNLLKSGCEFGPLDDRCWPSWLAPIGEGKLLK